MTRLVSKKSEKMLETLISQTRDMILSNGNADWKWHNSYLSETETLNTIHDMISLLKSKTRFLETDKKLNIITPEKAELEASVLKIVRKRLEERIAVYMEAV